MPCRVVPAVAGIGLLLVMAIKCVEWTVLGGVTWRFDPWVLAGLLAAQVILEPQRRSTLVTCAVGIPLGVLATVLQPAWGVFAEPICLGITSALVLCSRLLFRPGDRAHTLAVLASGSLVILAQQVAGSGETLSSAALLTFDQRAYLVDLSFGLDPVGTVLAAKAALPPALAAAAEVVLWLVYQNLLLAMAVVVLLHLRDRSRGWVRALAAFLLAGLAGGLIYHVFPAAGPVYAFPAFPELPSPSTLRTAATALNPEYPRNCMPSLHTTCALLIVMNSRGLSAAARKAAAVFAALTILSTMELGQHYLIDLVVAVPFTFAMQALATSLVTRAWPPRLFYRDLGLVAAWLAVLVCRVEWFVDHPGVVTAASVATVALSLHPGVGARIQLGRPFMARPRLLLR